MSSSIGHRIFTKLCRSRLSSLSQRIIGARSISIEENAESVKNVSQTPELGKIHAAILKEFSNPLVVEHIEPPKQVQHNEVHINVIYNTEDILNKYIHIFFFNVYLIIIT